MAAAAAVEYSVFEDPMALQEPSPSHKSEDSHLPPPHMVQDPLSLGYGAFPMKRAPASATPALFDPRLISPNSRAPRTSDRQANPSSQPSQSPPLRTSSSSLLPLPQYSIENEKEEVDAYLMKQSEAEKDFQMACELQAEFDRAASTGEPSRGKKRGHGDYTNNLEILDENDNDYIDGEKGFDAMEYEPGT